MSYIIGREKEIRELHDLYNSGNAEFVAIYGRRRVGKTFLVDEALKGKITFRHAGLSPVDEQNQKNNLKEQLTHFFFSLQMQGMKGGKCPSSWMEAFYMLVQLLEKKSKDNKRQVVFIDELPWLDTPRSGFMTAFEGFWNTWGCHRDNLMLVVCGSASSWMLDNLINNHGGLYGRTTYEIKLHPFTLTECEEFFRKKGIRMSRYDIVQSHMIVGGIPYYLG
jgi:AAA+ ATPase superfamily predicted ATPase